MSKLFSGIDIELNGDIHTLRPSLKAASAVCRQYGGYMGAIQAIAASDLNAYLFIAKQAISTKNINSNDLDEAIYAAGISNLIEPFLRYIRILQNGGKEPVDEDDADESDEGNGLHL